MCEFNTKAAWDHHCKMERDARDARIRADTVRAVSQSQGMVPDMGQSWGNQTTGLKTSSGDVELRKFALDMASRTITPAPGNFGTQQDMIIRAAREYEAYIKGK